MASGCLGFNRVEKCRTVDVRPNPKASDRSDMPKIKCDTVSKMPARLASAKIWQQCFNAFAEWQRWVFQVRALQKPPASSMSVISPMP